MTVKSQSSNTVKKNLQSIKDYIYIYGDENSSGNCFIKFTESSSSIDHNYGIVYEESGDKLRFIYYSQYDDSTSVIGMDVQTDKRNIIIPEYSLLLTA